MDVKTEEVKREELLAKIEQILNATPKRVLNALFYPATVAIQSEASSDGSFPPDLHKIASDEHCLIEIESYRYGKRSRSPGSYYYRWDAITKNGGLYMDANGEFFCAKVIGEGRYGQFPAYPGDTGVRLTIEYLPTGYGLQDLTDEDLELVWSKLNDCQESE